MDLNNVNIVNIALVFASLFKNLKRRKLLENTIREFQDLQHLYDNVFKFHYVFNFHTKN